MRKYFCDICELEIPDPVHKAIIESKLLTSKDSKVKFQIFAYANQDSVKSVYVHLCSKCVKLKMMEALNENLPD